MVLCCRLWEPAQPYPGGTMIRLLSNALFLFACITAPFLVGCSYERAESTPERSENADLSSGSSTDHKRAREARIREARADAADSSRVALAYPTGNRSTSAIL